MPRWRADGKELFFISPDLMLMAAPVSTGETFEYSVPQALFKPNLPAPNQRYQVGENGQRFLMPSLPEDSLDQPITVVLNWLESSKPR
jgi:hypothetical protein